MSLQRLRPLGLLRQLAPSVALALGVVACGGAAATPTPGFQPSVYDTQCEALVQAHAGDLAAGRYVPVELVVRPSLQSAAPAERKVLGERDLAAALAAPGTEKPTTLILARGGTGKSMLAKSIEAQTCKQMAVFRVDLQADIAARGEPSSPAQNLIAQHIAQQFHIPDGPGADAALKASLQGRQPLLLLDALDEVPVLQRPGIVAQIDDFVTRVLPGARAIVLTRPPVFTSDYGIQTLGLKLEIPQLTCAETDAAIARLVTDADERANFLAFAARYVLNRKIETPERCYYPHLSTYRDLQVVQRLARNMGYDKAASELKDFQPGRAQVYMYFATAQLLKDLQGVSIVPSAALDIVDRMVAAHRPDKGQRNLKFTLQSCVDVAWLDAAAAQGVCERILQSSLFATSGEGAWHFDNQSLGDLFLGRWAASSLVQNEKVDCTQVEQRSALLESSEVAGFLVGQASGQACFAEVAQAMCRKAGYAQNVFEQLDQGLPAGPQRALILAAADKKLHTLPPDPCASTLVDRLGKEAVPAAGAVAPPPAKPAKPAHVKKP